MSVFDRRSKERIALSRAVANDEDARRGYRELIQACERFRTVLEYVMIHKEDSSYADLMHYEAATALDYYYGRKSADGHK